MRPAQVNAGRLEWDNNSSIADLLRTADLQEVIRTCTQKFRNCPACKYPRPDIRVDKYQFLCRSCGGGGNTYAWLILAMNLTPLEAIRYLAKFQLAKAVKDDR